MLSTIFPPNPQALLKRIVIHCYIRGKAAYPTVIVHEDHSRQIGRFSFRAHRKHRAFYVLDGHPSLIHHLVNMRQW